MRRRRRGRRTLAQRARRFARDVRAVSPVIGSILVLAIMVMAMAGVMLWGVPAIQGLQEEAEFRSALTQLVQINSDLRTLRDPENTRVATLAVSRGSVAMETGSRWLVTVHADATYSGLNITGWESDTASSLTVTGVPQSSSVRVEEALGGTFTTITSNAACLTTCVLSLGSYRLLDATTRIQFKVGSTLKAETWAFDAGRLSYQESADSTFNRAHIEMGGVFTQEGSAVFMDQDPTWKEPVYSVTPQDNSYLVRVFQMDGDTSVSGKGRHTIYASLIDNYGVSRGRPLVDVAYSVRLQVDDGKAAATTGILEEGYCNYFDALDHYTQQGGTCSGGTVNLLFDPPNTGSYNNGKFLFHLNQAVVSVIVE